MIPNCIRLTQPQLDKLDRFKRYLKKNVSREVLREAAEEDMSMASPLTFKVFSTGLGDAIVVEGFGHICTLTIGDDGEPISDGF